MTDFGISIGERREAPPPLPLWVLFQWERRILQSAPTRYEVLMLGSFLLITWAGLRFADAQRMNVDSLVFNFQELRGLVWRSKTMAAGHPFGVQASGLCSLGTFTWLYKFLRTWDEVMHELQISRARCDFLIPTMSPDGSFSTFEPLDYAGATKFFPGYVAGTMEELARATPAGQASDAIHAAFHESDVTELWPATGFPCQ